MLRNQQKSCSMMRRKRDKNWRRRSLRNLKHLLREETDHKLLVPKMKSPKRPKSSQRTLWSEEGAVCSASHEARHVMPRVLVHQCFRLEKFKIKRILKRIRVRTTEKFQNTYRNSTKIERTKRSRD